MRVSGIASNDIEAYRLVPNTDPSSRERRDYCRAVVFNLGDATAVGVVCHVSRGRERFWQKYL